MFSSLFELMGMMFLLILSGFLLRKKNIITAAGKKCLTDIILYAILPCNIIKAFSQDMGDNFWVKFMQVLIIAVVAQFLSLLIASYGYRKIADGERQVYQYGTVCSNSGFMGNPLAEGVFGDIGLLYASVFLIPQRIVMWTAGVSYFQKGDHKADLYKKVLLHPCMIATYIGMIIMVFRLHLPVVLDSTIRSVSNCCTAMTMMYIGTILVDVDVKTLLNKRQIYFAILRLIVIPLAVFAVCRVCSINPLVMGVAVLLSATPAGSTTSLLAAKYGADEVAAAKSVVFTTLLSVITIPVWSTILLSFL